MRDRWYKVGDSVSYPTEDYDFFKVCRIREEHADRLAALANGDAESGMKPKHRKLSDRNKEAIIVSTESGDVYGVYNHDGMFWIIQQRAHPVSRYEKEAKRLLDAAIEENARRYEDE